MYTLKPITSIIIITISWSWCWTAKCSAVLPASRSLFSPSGAALVFFAYGTHRHASQLFGLATLLAILVCPARSLRKERAHGDPQVIHHRNNHFNPLRDFEAALARRAGRLPAARGERARRRRVVARLELFTGASADTARAALAAHGNDADAAAGQWSSNSWRHRARRFTKTSSQAA